MSTPSPLNSLNPPKVGGTSRMRFAVALIVSAHVIVIGGLLLQGCNQKAAKIEEPTATATNLVETPLFTAATNPPASSNISGLAPLGNAPLPGFSAPVAHSNGIAAAPVAPLPLPEPVPAPAETTQPKEYTVAKGDSPAKIAKANGVSLNALMAANPGLVPSKLKIGQKIAIPAPAAAPAGATPSAPAGAASAAATSGNSPAISTAAPAGSHVVKAGDTLTKIAKQHGVSVAQLRAANGMKTNRLLVGQKLKIPAGKPAATAQAQ